MVTDLGKALDPAADKLIQIAMMLCAATRTKAAWLLIGLHIVRELSLAALGARVLQCTRKGVLRALVRKALHGGDIHCHGRGTVLAGYAGRAPCTAESLCALRS